MKRFLVLVTIVGGSAWLLYLFSLGGPARTVVAALAYVLAGYVIWRAAPAVRDDFRALRGHLPISTKRGDHL